MRRPSSNVTVAAGLWMLLTAASPVSAGPVMIFVTIAEAQTNFLLDRNQPVGLNSAGVVVFAGWVPIDETTLSIGVFSGSGGPITSVASPLDEPFSAAFDPSISDSGKVAFLARIDQIYGIFRKDGSGPATEVVENGFDGPGVGGPLDLTTGPSGCTLGCDVANNGTVIFRARLPSGNHGIYVGSGGPVAPLFEPPDTRFDVLPGAVINNAGRAAFVMSQDGFKTLITTTLGGPLEGFVGTKEAFADLDVSLSIADNGTVAFIGQLRNGLKGVFAVNTSGHVSTLIDSSGPYKEFFSVSIDNHGGVAFAATLDQGGGIGMYRGPDPILHKVLAVGDQLSDKTVAEVRLDRDGLNDAGRIALYVRFTEGTERIVRGDPLVNVRAVDLASLNAYAQFTTGDGTGVDMTQFIPLPQGRFDLSFDVDFLTQTGELLVMLGDRVLGAFKSSDSGRLVFRDLDPLSLSPRLPGVPGTIPLRFSLSGPPGAVVRLDDIVLPGIVNGQFDVGYLDGWTFDASRGGAVIASAFDTPAARRRGRGPQ